MTWPIVDLTFWNPGDGRTPAIDALLADPSTPLARHGLTGIAAAYARETGAFLHEVHRHWAEELCLRTLAADGALTEVVPLLNGEGIPFFVAKGPVIAYRDYPDPSMRPYCDLDIYVVGSRVAEARTLLAGYGYAPVHHAVGALGGLAQEVHGGRFSAVVEVHAHPIDNLHRRYLPPIEAFLEHVEHAELCGVKSPVLSPSADLALQVIHLAAGHRYAKLVLLRDIEIAQRVAHLDVVASLGVGASTGTTLDVLRSLGREVQADVPGGVARRRLVATLTKSDPCSWDEYRLSEANVLALLNQPSWAAAGRAIIAAAPTLAPRRRRRVSVRLSSPIRGPLGEEQALDIGVFGARGIPSTYSGYETFLTVLLPELVARGHRVTMYCRRSDVDGDGPYHGVERVFLPASSRKQFSTLSHGLVATAVARARRHDVLLAVNVANSLYCLAARATGQRVVLNTDGQEWLRGKWGRVARAYFKGSAHLARFSASAIVADSVGMQTIYAEQFHARSTVIPYCWTEIDSVERPEALEALGLVPGGYFLIAGRLIPENNIDGVVDAWLQSGVETPLVVLGTANYDSPVQRRLTDVAQQNPRLIIGGHIDDRASYATLVRNAKCYVHAHSVGGINPSLVEAMGCGARIVALSTPFNREALGDAGAYFDDLRRLPKMLARVVSEDDVTSETLRRLARKRASREFSLPIVAGAYEDLFRSAAAAVSWQRVANVTQWATDRADPALRIA